MNKGAAHFLHFLIFLAISVNLPAQMAIIEGVVKDAGNLKPIADCSILLLNTSQGTTSNSEGKFKITLQEKRLPAAIVASSLGYSTDTIYLQAKKESYDIVLKPYTGTFAEVVVTGVSKAT